MCFAITSGGGMDLGLPDVCLTGPVPVPVPYPNTALRAMGVAVADTILFAGAPAHNLGTVVPLTMGDEAGTAGGVVSGTDMGPDRRLTPCTSILLKGKPAVRLGAQGPQNGTNCMGTTVVPSQTKVLLLAG
jgi:hypothetical protein